LYRGDIMLIDNEEIFDTDKDKLVWNKIITVNPLVTNDTKSTHIVKYYKTGSSEEYYIFEYIMADNNGLKLDNFDGHHWRELIKQIDFIDNCFIYSQNGIDRDFFRFVTSGKIIRKFIEEYTEEYTRIYELGHR